MSSGYEQVDPRMPNRASEAPQWNGRAPAGDWPRRDAQRALERELQNIQTPLPQGIEGRIRQLQKMRGPVNPPEKFEFWPPPPPGQGPRQVEPDPVPPPQPPMRSVLRQVEL